MRRILFLSCISALIFASSQGWAVSNTQNDATMSGAKAYEQTELAQQTGENSEGATPVTEKAESGLDYSSGGGDSAAKTDMAIDVGVMVGDRLVRNLVQATGSETASNILSFHKPIPLKDEWQWFSIFISWDLINTATTLGHAAVNKFMRDATYITASFAGDQGHVTDKWVGPPNRNKTIAIMGDVGVTSKRFTGLAFNADDYKGLSNAKEATAVELQEYRMETIIENQRSLKNVTDENYQMLYDAQQRCIRYLTGALELKAQLMALAEEDSKIKEECDTKPQALNMLASRRAVHDALLLLKANIMAARARLRAEMLELDFKPLTKESE